MSDLALIVGKGSLPAALAAALPVHPYVCALDGFLPHGLKPDLVFRLERLVPLMRHLQDRGIKRLAFAGAVTRPQLDPALFDPATAQLVPALVAALADGDDATLRGVIAMFEDEGFQVQGPADLAPGLMPGPGVLVGNPTPRDAADAARAAEIMAIIGPADVGQACVVAEGLCLGIEALPGTDALLGFVAGLGEDLHRRGRGVLYKAAKPGQDLRLDLPTLGPETVRAAGQAGLAGIAFQAGQVICLDLPRMQRLAAALGLFLWAR